MLKRKYYEKNQKIKDLYKVLLQPGDVNVRVTVRKKYEEDGAWKEVFRDVIGGGIVHDSKNQYMVRISTDSGKEIQTADLGCDVIRNNFDFFKDEDIVRIDLIKFPTELHNPRTCIVV